jgi:hypothetical protein
MSASSRSLPVSDRRQRLARRVDCLLFWNTVLARGTVTVSGDDAGAAEVRRDFVSKKRAASPSTPLLVVGAASPVQRPGRRPSRVPRQMEKPWRALVKGLCGRRPSTAAATTWISWSSAGFVTELRNSDMKSVSVSHLAWLREARMTSASWVAATRLERAAA